MCVAADFVVRSPFPCGDRSKAGAEIAMPRETAAITADEAGEFVDLVKNSTPVSCGVVLGGSPSESPWAMLSCQTQARFITHLAVPCVSFCFMSSSICFGFFVRLTYLSGCISFISELYPCELYLEVGIMRLLYFNVLFTWRACWLSGVLREHRH